MKTIVIFLAFSVCVLGQNQPRNQNVVAGEYFINGDPGEGNGTPLSSTYGYATANITISPALSSNDVVYIRFKSSNGLWGPPRAFKNNYPIRASGSVIQGGEYFLNTDPGTGNAMGFTFQNGNEITVPSISANRNDRVYLRVKDSYGRWSDAVCRSYRYKNLIGAQYKIKFKSGTTTAWQNMLIQNQGLPSAYFSALTDTTASVGNGDTVFVRFQSEDYIWGIIFNNYEVTAVKNRTNTIPTRFSLDNAYPNPFNPNTTIGFGVPEIAHVKLSVYDILGREVAALVDKEVAPGVYNVTFDANRLSSGVYFYRLDAGTYHDIKKFLLLK